MSNHIVILSFLLHDASPINSAMYDLISRSSGVATFCLSPLLAPHPHTLRIISLWLGFSRARASTIFILSLCASVRIMVLPKLVDGEGVAEAVGMAVDDFRKFP
jgi:hypothetical protein